MVVGEEVEEVQHLEAEQVAGVAEEVVVEVVVVEEVVVVGPQHSQVVTDVLVAKDQG